MHSDQARRKSVQTRQNRATFLALKHGPKIDDYRSQDMTWEQVADQMMLSVKTTRSRYNFWLQSENKSVESVSDKKHRAWQLRSRGYKIRQISDEMKASDDAVKKWLQRWSPSKDEEYLQQRQNRA